MGTIRVRTALVTDAEAMARVHVRSWQETYRGLMSDEVLDDPDAVAKRTRFWQVVLGDERFAHRRSAVAVSGEEVIGVAMAQPSQRDEPQQLHVLYVLQSEHGTDAGSALLNAVLNHDEAAALWVADPNPRAQAFYRKHRFRDDGTSKEEDGVREVHMVRPPRSA